MIQCRDSIRAAVKGHAQKLDQCLHAKVVAKIQRLDAGGKVNQIACSLLLPGLACNEERYGFGNRLRHTVHRAAGVDTDHHWPLFSCLFNATQLFLLVMLLHALNALHVKTHQA